MNKLIEQELTKVKNTNLPLYNKDTTVIYIPKKITNVEMNKNYLIQLLFNLENPDESIKSMFNDFNQCIYPKEIFLEACITDSKMNMVHIDSIGKDTRSNWSGWLLKSQFKIISQL